MIDIRDFNGEASIDAKLINVSDSLNRMTRNDYKLGEPNAEEQFGIRSPQQDF